MPTASSMREHFKKHHDAERMAKCDHAEYLFWYGSPADERGWICADCGWMPGEAPGYSPEHDRSHIHTKTDSILHDLNDAGIVCVSNGSSGEAIASAVADRCVREGIYDSVSIARFILELGADSHAKFWKDRSDSIINGSDNRDRCRCGKLANCTTWRDGKRTTTCSAHSVWLDDATASTASAARKGE
jgi:hypothetical protein